jgi:hypothetical protein
MRLELVEGTYAVARLASDDAVPEGLLDPSRDGVGNEGGELVAVTRTGEELSIVAPMALLHHERPSGTQYRASQGRSRQIGAAQRAFRVAGTLDHSLTGVLLSLAAPLADAGVPIFAVSTWDTDYVLVPDDRVEDAIAALEAADHEVE